MNLKAWTSSYIDYLDSFKKSLVSKNDKENIIDCEYSDKGKINYVICEDLNFCKYNENSVIICLNSKKNLDVLISKWNDFSKNIKLKIVFANPIQNLQWSIIPYLHNKYGDPESLKVGLKSLFNSIPKI
ncbi:hypothetical protein HN789_04985 [archaeon]|jgi:hypothetical protein|nr:hypothetical protein [archaeon]MBT4022867.1 hypothetical protein [archaeon]MBT4272514.1 hypothetical protein [archaeon]MBT4460418.1 hypothetical protein [archaeon]MBT4859049.1 hypothetical protein [archaeon]